MAPDTLQLLRVPTMDRSGGASPTRTPLCVEASSYLVREEDLRIQLQGRRPSLFSFSRNREDSPTPLNDLLPLPFLFSSCSVPPLPLCCSFCYWGIHSLPLPGKMILLFPNLLRQTFYFLCFSIVGRLSSYMVMSLMKLAS